MPKRKPKRPRWRQPTNEGVTTMKWSKKIFHTNATGVTTQDAKEARKGPLRKTEGPTTAKRNEGWHGTTDVRQSNAKDGDKNRAAKNAAWGSIYQKKTAPQDAERTKCYFSESVEQCT